MTIYTNDNLTIRDRKIITACLKDYRELCVDDAGDVNIMGLTFEEDQAVEMCCDTKLWKTVDEIVARVNADQMLLSDFDVIYACFNDALDQYAVSNGECGFITCADDFAAMQTILFKLKNNGKRYVALEETKMLQLVADALCGHYGAEINDYDVCGDLHDTSVRNYLCKLGMIMGATIDPDVATTAWAMAILNIRDLTIGSNMDAVRNLAEELGEII